MSCHRFRHDIALHAGADLPARRAERLQRHLEDCTSCRLLLEQLTADRRAMRQLADPPANGDRLATSRAAVLERIAKRPAEAGSGHRAWPALAATVLMALALTTVFLTRSRQQTESPPAGDGVEIAHLEPSPLPRPAVVEADQPNPAETEIGAASENALIETTVIEADEETDRERHVPAPQPLRIAAMTPLQPEVPRLGDAFKTLPEPPPSPDPTLVKLVSEKEDVVIFWLLDTTDPGLQQPDEPSNNPNLSSLREEHRYGQQELSRG